MGGDITGKAVVPIIRGADGLRVPELIGDRVAGEDELETLERRIRDRGFYPYVTSEAELAGAHGDSAAIDGCSSGRWRTACGTGWSWHRNGWRAARSGST